MKRYEDCQELPVLLLILVTVSGRYIGCNIAWKKQKLFERKCHTCMGILVVIFLNYIHDRKAFSVEEAFLLSKYFQIFNKIFFPTTS
jgi:hypothetical protein